MGCKPEISVNFAFGDFQSVGLKNLVIWSVVISEVCKLFGVRLLVRLSGLLAGMSFFSVGLSGLLAGMSFSVGLSELLAGLSFSCRIIRITRGHVAFADALTWIPCRHVTYFPRPLGWTASPDALHTKAS